MKDIKRGEICDSIRINMSLQITNFKEVVRKDNDIIKLHENRIATLNEDLGKANKKLKISKKLTTFGIPIALGGGFLIGVLLK